MPSDPYQNALTILNAQGNLRVWSLLATVFGDLAQGQGDQIEGPVLSALMSEMQIKPEATRVALHRLRNDDWIASDKAGRTSLHRLTDTGRRESAAASHRIYAPPATAARDWQIVLLETSAAESRDRMNKLGFAPLTSRIYVGLNTAQPPAGALSMPGTEPPAWFGEQLEPKALAQEYAALHDRLQAVQALELDPRRLTPIQIGALRCLIVHGWRRLVLRHPDLPSHLYSSKWKGDACRALVAALLAQLPRPTREALHDC